MAVNGDSTVIDYIDDADNSYIPLSGRRSLGGSTIMAAGATRNMLSTLRGVYIPCCLSIFGIILFLRMGWVVGQAGLLQSFAFMVLGESVVLTTVLSICAICTNGKMKGGGTYFMISRVLGPEFGGSVGIIFYLANILAAAQYLKAFGNELKDTFSLNLFGDDFVYWELVFLPSVCLLVTFIISWIGAEAYAKTTMTIFFVLMVSILFGFISFFVPYTTLERHPQTIYAGEHYFHTPNVQTLSDNLFPAFSKAPTAALCPNYTGSESSEPYDFFSVFAVFFNAITGINAGANMSGDLANPGKSLPLGTLGALLTSGAVYLAFMIILSASIDRHALQCVYPVLQNVAIWPPLVYVGIIVSLFASSLGSIIGGARILQALSRDELIPGMARFGKGTLKGNEPRNALLLSWVICQALLFIESLNVIAAITTLFFLLSYGITNLACFLLAISGTPNFRPMFRYYHWSTALFGFIDCIVVMFLIDPAYSGAAVAIMLICFGIIFFRAPVTGWGDISQALLYHQVRKYILRLDTNKKHAKFWRPGLLLLLKTPTAAPELLQFCDKLKKGGLYCVGHVLVGDRTTKGTRSKVDLELLQDVILKKGVKAFPDVIIADSVRSGTQMLMQTAGLGCMKPNSLVMGFPSDIINISAKSDSGFSCVDYTDVIRDALFLEKNVLLARHFDQLDMFFIQASKKKSNPRKEDAVTIDVWLPGPHDWEVMEVSAKLALQLAWILHDNEEWMKHTIIRVLSYTVRADEVEEHKQRVEALLLKARIVASVVVFSLEGEGSTARSRSARLSIRSSTVAISNFFEYDAVQRNQIVNGCFEYYSSHKAGLTFLPVMYPPVESSTNREAVDRKYLTELNALADGMPPVILVMGIEDVMVTAL